MSQQERCRERDTSEESDDVPRISTGGMTRDGCRVAQGRCAESRHPGARSRRVSPNLLREREGPGLAARGDAHEAVAAQEVGSIPAQNPKASAARSKSAEDTRSIIPQRPAPAHRA